MIADEQESGASSVTYSLTGSPGPFTINSVSGVITTTAMLDREQQASYVLTVEATDNAPIPLSSFVQVIILLLYFLIIKIFKITKTQHTVNNIQGKVVFPLPAYLSS